MSNPYLESLLPLLKDLEKNTPAARRDLYRQASDQLLERLKSSEPPANQADVEYETRLLAYTVRQIETDIRDGVDVFAEGYNPEELTDIEAKLAVIREKNKRSRPAPAQTEAQKQRLAIKAQEYWQDLLQLQRFSSLTSPSPGQRFFATLYALTEFAFANMRRENRLYLLGELVLPMFYVAVIIGIYYFLDMKFVYNMDIIQFAFTGAVCWVMCRQTMLRVSVVLTRPLLQGFWQVSNLHRSLSSAFLSFFVHSVSLLLMIFAGVLIGVLSLPYDPVAAFIGWFVIWVMGHNFGVIITGLTIQLRRTAMIKMVVFRLMQFVFGMYFVSEQFPADIKYYILLSPFVHVMQFFRSAWFEVYQSQEIDYLYVAIWLGVSSVLAVYYCGRIARHVEAS